MSDGKFKTTAFGRIAVSELAKEMVENSIFIILNDTTRDQFLDASVLKKFRTALASSLTCDRSRIFIVSIEESRDFETLGVGASMNVGDGGGARIPMLEVVVAVRLDSDNSFYSSKVLKGTHCTQGFLSSYRPDDLVLILTQPRRQGGLYSFNFVQKMEIFRLVPLASGLN